MHGESRKEATSDTHTASDEILGGAWTAVGLVSHSQTSETTPIDIVGTDLQPLEILCSIVFDFCVTLILFPVVY